MRLQTAPIIRFFLLFFLVLFNPLLAYGENFSEGLAVISYKNHYGYIDKAGKWAIEPIFEKASKFSDGLAYVRVIILK